MPLNPWIIPKKPADPGSATAIVDIKRRLSSLEGRGGFVGSITLAPPGNAVTTGTIIPSTTGTDGTVEIQVGSVDGSQGVVIDIVADSSGPLRAITAQSFSSSGGILSFNAKAFIYTSGNGLWNGNLTAVSFITTSDERLKEDIQDVSSRGLEIHKLRPVSYKDQKGETHYGFVAQEAAKHIPHSVKEVDLGQEPGRAFGINMNSILTLTVAAVQDLNSRLEALERGSHGGRN